MSTFKTKDFKGDENSELKSVNFSKVVKGIQTAPICFSSFKIPWEWTIWDKYLEETSAISTCKIAIPLQDFGTKSGGNDFELLFIGVISIVTGCRLGNSCWQTIATHRFRQKEQKKERGDLQV